MWFCYKAYLEAKAPIHVGYGAKLGIVDRTRYYIPAKNIWGALTSLIAKSIMESYSPKTYQIVGEFLNENIKLSYFFPIEYWKDYGKIHVEQVFAPCYTDEGLKFGVCKNKKKISPEEFERIFISSFVSTALNKTSKSAEEGALHEIEFIKDKIKYDTETKPTFFMGYFFAKDKFLKINVEGKEVEITLENSIEVDGVKLNELWIGGERNYGFGKVKIFSLEKTDQKEVNLFNSGMKTDTTGENILVKSEDKNKIALSHVNIENLGIKVVKGDLEPLIGREWTEEGSGQKISQTAKICITPGSQFTCEDEMVIQNFGIWESSTS
ncbi:MAG: RAMP superfamily CRISPR-associated protein [Candidatus Baldrarchaeia archaeon]